MYSRRRPASVRPLKRLCGARRARRTCPEYFFRMSVEAVRRGGSERASAVTPTQQQAIERARELNPGHEPLVERVRHTNVGDPDKWRKP